MKVITPVVFKVTSDDGDQWNITLDILNHRVKDLKSAILNKKNKPFIFKHITTNDETLT